MGVGWTRVRHDVEPSRADSLPLASKHCHRVGASQRELEERSIRGEPVKTGDARLVALKFFEQTWYPLRKVPGAEIRRVSGWTFDNVRKTNPEARKLSILLWTEGVGTDRSAHALAQLRRGERGPEPARRTREVVSALNRVEPGIDPNEDEVEPWPEMVWQRPKRVSLVHPVGTVPRRRFLFCHAIGLQMEDAAKPA